MTDQAGTVDPALTPEEWAGWFRKSVLPLGDDGELFAHIRGYEYRFDHTATDDGRPGIYTTKLHGLAALCLHDQDFGFTRLDVTSLRWEAEGTYDRSLPLSNDLNVSARFKFDLADRIEALLPPENPDD